MFILEQRYGNDGYAFWFKLLELLGKTAGHSLDCNNPATWEFLQARTHLTADICTEILDLLAKLEAIDAGLWESKIVWSDNFVLGVADAYRNRLSEIPIRPDNLRKKPKPTPGPDNRNPQTKLKDTKRKENKDIPPKTSKIPKGKTPIPNDFSISEQVQAWAEKKGFDRLDEHLEAFIDTARAKGYVYVDWDSAFRKAIREDWGKIRQGESNEPKPPKHDKSCACGGRGVIFSHHRGEQKEPVYRKCRGKDEPKEPPPAA
jgi:hypothetical protein